MSVNSSVIKEVLFLEHLRPEEFTWMRYQHMHILRIRIKFSIQILQKLFFIVFSKSYGFHAYAFFKDIETQWNRNWTTYHYTYIICISFDAKFYAEFDFVIKNLFRPAVFEIFEKLKICVGGSQNFNILIGNLILIRNICICWYFIH